MRGRNGNAGGRGMRLSPAWLGTGAVHVYLGLQALTPGGGTQPSLEFSGSGLLSQVQSAPYTFFSINSLVHCANRSFRQRDPVDLVLEDARHASVDLWRDPNHPFRPSRPQCGCAGGILSIPVEEVSLGSPRVGTIHVHAPTPHTPPLQAFLADFSQQVGPLDHE